jgi:hypothetical protein
MRAHLSFNLPDDKDDFRLAQMGPELYSIVFELDQKLRGYLKHGHKFKDADDAIETILAELNEESQGMAIRFDSIS